ncbi:MAG TPA: hypothetical protein VJ806_10425 [Luteimonas sp.]|nr:hypothetical protein [Luteimonas sp.]
MNYLPRPMNALMLAMLAAGYGLTAASAPDPAATETAMPAEDRSIAHVADADAALEARFEYAEGAPLKVTYRLRNQGKAPLMVFDRGNRHAVLTKKLTQGDVAAPTFTQEDADLTLSHRALPLAKPHPIIPPTPLASRVEPGATLQGEFEFSLLTDVPVERVRWCLGVVPFADDFKALKPEPNKPEVWLGSLSHADRQRMLCTPWFDLPTEAFES